MFSIIVVSTQKRCSIFMRKALVFGKNCFRDKVMKRFKFSNDFRVKVCGSLKRRIILKIYNNVFQENLCFSCLLLNGISTNKFCPVLRILTEKQHLKRIPSNSTVREKYDSHIFKGPCIKTSISWRY